MHFHHFFDCVNLPLFLTSWYNAERLPELTWEEEAEPVISDQSLLSHSMRGVLINLFKGTRC